MKTASFLLELGTEELPPKLLNNLSKQLANYLDEQLTQHYLSFGDIEVFATPRRLAVLVKHLSIKQDNRVLTKKGPAINAPEQAILGFCRSVGVDSVKALTIKSVGQSDYYFYQTTQIGQKTTGLLASIIPLVISQISSDKMMHWGLENYHFIRPTHWLVALLDNHIVPINVLGLSSSRTTKGLRFANINQLNISHANNYQNQLNQLFIEPDFQKRKVIIVKQIEQLSQQTKTNIPVDKNLLNEVCALVESPKAFMGNFDKEFLKIPEEVLILAMASHQKYFPVFNQHAKLKASFVAVANLTDQQQSLKTVILGNERVIKARLADAQFFWQQDIAMTLKARLEQLKSVIFMQSLGSLFDQTKRLESLMGFMADTLSNPMIQSDISKRCGLLSKSDLVSSMVIEFPKLQGIMGGYYANNDQEDISIVTAIKEQYYPKFSGDTLPNTLMGSLLSIANKLDTITGIYGLGKIPTGSKDPYALRRLAIGLARIMIESKIEINLVSLIKYALNLHTSQVNKGQETLDKITAFILERLKIYYIEQGININIYHAVTLNKAGSLYDFDQRILALRAFSQQPQAQNLITLNKRILNTLKDSFKDNKFTISAIKPSLLTKTAEISLFNQINVLKASHYENYEQKMLALCGLEPTINDFFETVMVNVEQNNIRENRLNLLGNIREILLSVADLSHL